MNTLDRIKKAHIAIMRHPKACVYAGVLACGKVEVTTSVPTAATDGWNVKYNPEFIGEYMATDPELRFLVLHEATHKAYRHLHTWASLHAENAQLANIACDHFVNLALQDMDAGEGFIKMPKVGIQPDPKYRGWSVKQIFDDLKQTEDGQDGDGDGEGLDDHEWGDGPPGTGDESTEAARASEIAQAVRQGEMLRRKLAGRGAGGMDGVFGDLLAPKIDWRKALREFISELCRGNDESSWSRPNRRFLSDDIYMPGWMSTTMTELVVAIDTSGSVFHGPEMQRFVTELTTITEQVRPQRVHVIYWDSAVCGHQTFDDGQFAVQNLKPRGGGGTDAACVFDYLRTKRITPQAIVVLTDGYVSSWGKADAPTLWAITTDRKAPFGTTIHIEG